MQLLDGGCLLLHVVPLAAVAIGPTLSLSAAAQSVNRFPPIANASPRDYQMTFDGLLTTSNADSPPAPQRAYTLVMRNGIVEGVASSLARGQQHNLIYSPQLEAMIVRYGTTYVQALASLGLEPPFAIMASLIDVQGKLLMHTPPSQGAFAEDLPSVALRKHSYEFIEAILDTVPADYNGTAQKIRATLDHVAQAAGLPASPHFDADGNFVLKL